MTEELIARWLIIGAIGIGAFWALWTWLDRKIEAINARLTAHGEQIAALRARKCACEDGDG